MCLLLKSLFVNLAHLPHSRFPHNTWRQFGPFVQVKEEGSQWTSRDWFAGGTVLLEQQWPCHCTFMSVCLSVLFSRGGWSRSLQSLPGHVFLYPLPNKNSLLTMSIPYVNSGSIYLLMSGHLLLSVHPLVFALGTPRPHVCVLEEEDRVRFIINKGGF